MPDPICAYFFRNFIPSLKTNKQKHSVYFTSFLLYISSYLLSFTAKFGKSCLHLLIFFLPFSFIDSPSLIWILPHSSMKTLLQSLPVIFLVFNWRGCVIIFLSLTLQPFVEILSFPWLLWYFFLTSFFSQLLLLYLITKTQSLSDSFCLGLFFFTFLCSLFQQPHPLSWFQLTFESQWLQTQTFSSDFWAPELHPELSFWNTPLIHRDYSKLNMTLKNILVFLQSETWQSLWALWSLTHLVHSLP